MTSGGLLISGIVVPVAGVRIVSPVDDPDCKLDGGDYRPRRTSWIRQVIAHTTKGNWPQYVKAGAGAPGAARAVAQMWYRDPEHSAAQIAIDRDGTVWCLADLATVCAYHATTSNDWSVGIEMFQDSDGGVFEATYDAAELIIPAICEALSIPFQVAADRYVNGKIIDRMLHGGADCVGVFGHRDQAWDFAANTSSRGRGDPGDEIYTRLIAAGAEPLNFGAKQDLATWIPRQRKLNARGAQLTEDGVAGPGTMAAMRRNGFANGRALDAA